MQLFEKQICGIPTRQQIAFKHILDYSWVIPTRFPYIEVRDSWTGYFIPVRYGMGVWPDGRVVGAPPSASSGDQNLTLTVLVFGPESVSYERSRRETAAKFYHCPARVFLKKQHSLFSSMSRFPGYHNCLFSSTSRFPGYEHDLCSNIFIITSHPDGFPTYKNLIFRKANPNSIKQIL